MWRSLVIAFALGAVVVAAAAAKDPWDPFTKIRAADQAKATAALLTQNDLGLAWKSVAVPKPLSFKAPSCPQQRPNDGDLTIVGHAESTFYNGNGGIQVDSDVEVFPTAKQAAARFNRFIQPKLYTCLKYDLDKSAGAKLKYLAGSRLTFPKVAERTAAFRIPIIQGSGVVYSDFIFVGSGRSQAYINLIAPSVQASQLTGFELSLAKLLVKRLPA